MLAWGFFVSTVLSITQSTALTRLATPSASRRFNSADTSRNNLLWPYLRSAMDGTITIITISDQRVTAFTGGKSTYTHYILKGLS